MLSTLTLTAQSDKLFFGESGHGLCRYDQPRHPIFKTVNDKMKSLFWNPNEIDLSQEKASFNKLTDAEKFVFTENLKRQILLDSIQGRSPSLVFIPSCTDSSLENCLITWGFFESLHSESYTHIIRAIYPDPSIVFDSIPSIQPIVACASSITSAYDRMMAYPSKENLYLALIAANALEAIRFFVSFACTFSFGERGLVEGSAKEVKFIARDEACLHPDTEVLTTTGWRKILDITILEEVAQLNMDTSEVSFSKPLKIIRKKYKGGMCKFIYKNSGKVLQNVTEDHDILISPLNPNKKEFSRLKKYKAARVNLHGFNYIPVSGTTSSETTLKDEERLLIAIQADGNISNRYTGELCGTVPVRIGLTRPRKIARLTELLTRLGYTYTIIKRKGGEENTFHINVPISVAPDKTFGWIDIGKLTTTWGREFMEELVEWDGHKPKDSDYLYYSNTNESAIDKVQAILSFTGYKHRRGIQVDNREERYKDIHRIYWWEEPDNMGVIPTQSMAKETYEYDGEVGCLTMPHGTLITRYNGNVCITGNCHLALVQHILKRLPEDDPDFVQIIGDLRHEAIAIFDDTGNQEKAWATDYIFQHGTILGLNEKILADYIDNKVVRAKAAVKLTTTSKFEPSNIPWMNKWLTDSNYQPAPQEVEGTAYLTSSLKNDISELDFKL